MKITIISAVHGRKYLWGLFAQGVKDLKEELEKYYEVDTVVSCTNEEECEYFLSKGFTTILTGNKYLGRKWNEAFYYSWTEGADYILMLGSDNIISTKAVKYYKENIEANRDVFGFNKLIFLNYMDDRIKHFNGHPPEFRLSIGAGKMISKKALTKVNGRPAEEEITRGLDTSIMVQLRYAGFNDYIIKIEEYLILDIKNQENINSFESIRGREIEADYQKLNKQFNIIIK